MEVFDRAAALERADGDEERLEDLVASFRARAPATVSKIEKALRRRKGARIEKEASALLSSAVEIGAEGLSDLARQMIAAVGENDFEKVETLVTHMGMELDWLLRILDQNRCSGNL